MSQEKKKRNLNADLIRCIAVFSVISVHFLLNSGFYRETVQGLPVWIMCLHRSFFMTCVPMFLLLTGYLMNQKKLSRQYYRGLWKTVEIYLLVSIVDILFKILVQGKGFTPYEAFLSILAFKGANYSWYIEMYIGLFLMIPFLNLAWNGLENEKQKRCLVLTMAVLTMLPKMLNNFNLTDSSWWLSPRSSDDYNKLVPSFFTAMYPVTYYFTGAYLKEYGLKISRKKNVLLFVLAVVLFGTYNCYRSYGGKFIWGSNSTWGGENMITAVLWFQLLLGTHPERWPKLIQHFLVRISRISLGIYLLSWIFDQIVYPVYLKPNVPEVIDRFKYYPLAAGSVFLGAAVSAALLYFIRDLGHRAVSRLTSRNAN